MIFGKRKTIGVFVNKTDEYFDNTINRQIQILAKEMNYDVFVFATVGYHQSNNDYDTQEKGMFDFVPVEQLDGIIVVPDSYEMQGFRESLLTMLHDRATCPVVAIRYKGNEFDCVYTDENGAIRPLIRHLIKDHGLKKIAFMAGYPGHIDSEARLQCYREEMAKAGLEIPDRGICYGTMWTSDGPKAYKHYFSNPENRPEAIVCANDYMAVGLIEELRKHDIRVPEDVIVTGFDNIQETGRNMMTLTTIAQDYEGMLTVAFHQLDKRIRCMREDDVREEGIAAIGLDGKLVLGESCGCMQRDIDILQRAGVASALRATELASREISMTYLTIELSGCEDLRDVHEVLVRKRRDTLIRRDFYLCLFEKENDINGKRIFAEEVTDNVCLVSNIRDMEDGGMPMISFDRHSILPPMAEKPDEPQVFFLMLLHQGESTFGYAVTRYTDGACPTPFFHHWNVVLAGALRNMHNRLRLQGLYEERRLSSVTDELTQTFNRRGMEEQVTPMWPHLCLRQEIVGFVYFDLDGLKQINDGFGHSAGDFAIRMGAKAMQVSAPKDAVVARMGGDEFLVFIPQTTEAAVRKYLDRFAGTLEKMNDEARRAFRVETSCGAFVTRLDADTTLEQCIRESDQKMYQQKLEHHARLQKES